MYLLSFVRSFVRSLFLSNASTYAIENVGWHRYCFAANAPAGNETGNYVRMYIIRVPRRAPDREDAPILRVRFPSVTLASPSIDN